MARRVQPLTLDLLAQLETVGCPCRTCVTWALDPVRRNRLGQGVGSDAGRAEAKDAWVSELLLE